MGAGARAGVRRGLASIPVTMPASTFPALAALHIAVLLFGFAGLFGKWLALAPATIVLGRTLVAAIALGALVAARREPARLTAGLAGNGIVLAVHWVSFFEAIRVSTIAIGLLGYASFPLFVLVLERAMLGRRWHAAEATTALLVAAGLVVLVPRFAWEERTVQGLLWGIVSGFTFALLAVRSRRHAATHAPAAVALWQNAIAAAVLVPLVVAAAPEAAAFTWRDAALLLVLGVLCTAIAHTLFIDSLRRVSAHTASVVAALEPVYGIALAMLLLGEVPSPRTLAGAALLVGAALVATRRAA
jgi:drug/metabolite transporter (DMT)-like permease